MQIDVCAALELSPDVRVGVNRGEDADERAAVDDAMKLACVYLGEDRAVGELGPERCADRVLLWRGRRRSTLEWRGDLRK